MSGRTIHVTPDDLDRLRRAVDEAQAPMTRTDPTSTRCARLSTAR